MHSWDQDGSSKNIIFQEPCAARLTYPRILPLLVINRLLSPVLSEVNRNAVTDSQEKQRLRSGGPLDAKESCSLPLLC